jgi:hypothetical protein
MSNTVTLNKFGVPNADGSKGIGVGNGDLLQLKYKYRFRVIVYNFGGTGTNGVAFTQQVQSAGKPSVTFEEIKVASYNSTAYLAGKHSWEAVDVKVKDDSSNTVSKLIGAQLQQQLNMYDQSADAAGVDYKFQMQIDTLDGTNSGTPLESWWLEGCYLASVKYGELDYSSGSEFQTIDMSIRFDNATAAAILPTGTGEKPFFTNETLN